MSTTRDNHYIPQWYQKGFLDGKEELFYLNLNPDVIIHSSTGKPILKDGKPKTYNDLKQQPTSKCFFQTDLYSTFFGRYINDEIERMLFGKIDCDGAKAVRAFIGEDVSEWHKYFSNFFSYIDTQKIRTPKGLSWIAKHYPNLNQNNLMLEMQAIRNLHCTIWTEGVREIVSASESEIKFILSDHPVTIYNYAYPPESKECIYPDDPSIALKATQTVFPLDMNHCLILTNLEYAQNPDTESPTEKRTNARNFRNSMVRTDTFIKSRTLDAEGVEKINFIIKSRAYRYIAASNKDWLYPNIDLNWSEMKEVLLPPSNELWHYGGETYVGYEDGSTHFQDAFGRTTPENKYLKKPKREKEPKPNEPCGCGQGRKYKKCCKGKPEELRPSWTEDSIRERNLTLYNGINDILGFNKGKTWEDVRRELSNDQVKRIHELYGFLWPRDTDLASLLPKPDNNLRALYTGIIDPRLISHFAVGLTPYFDEIIIQHPFINPASVKSEYSPVESPHKYKQQTLKNVMLFLTLMPFIERGYINFIPDICSFDSHLQQQMFHMAEERSGSIQINEQQNRLMKELHKDDFQRTMFMLPKNAQRKQIKRALPNLSEEEVEKTLEYIEEQKQKDPFALLQDDVLGSKDGGQLMVMHMLPNFEISLLLAQITGAFLLTDSPYRWNEMLNAQSKTNGMVIYNWSGLSECMIKQQYIVNSNSQETFSLRDSGKLGNFRKAIKEIYSTLQECHNPSDELVERIKKQLVQAHHMSCKEVNNNAEFAFSSKFNCIVPRGGIVHNNVRRMLLSSGQENYLNNVPMAIFVEPYGE